MFHIFTGFHFTCPSERESTGDIWKGGGVEKIDWTQNNLINRENYGNIKKKKSCPLKLVRLPDWSWREVKPNKLHSNR